MAITIKTPEQIAAMRDGGRILATILHSLKDQTKAGMTPQDLSFIAKQELRRLGGQPTFLGYGGNPAFPDIICISVNNQVQHSIPSATPLENGDVVNLDFGVTYKGLVTDGGLTFLVGGHGSPDRERLVKGTEAALSAGLDKVKAGNRVGDISAAIEATLTSYHLGIVRDLVGHGVGYELHEDPEIPNYGVAGRGPLLKAGMTIAIEPITTLGGEKIIGDRDGWTLWTADGSDSAQFEHTVLVTAAGCDVLTAI